MSNDKFVVQDGLTINTIEVFTADGVLIGPSGNTLNASYTHANSAYDQANLAFDTANTKVNKSGDTMTGDLNIETANVRANVVIVNQTLYSGLATASATPLPNVITQFTGNTDSYVQVNAQNIDPIGSADFVVTSDIGTDSTFYIDMGLNGSNSYDSENASSIGPLDGYLYVQGSDIGQLGGNLILGTSTTDTPGLETKIVSGGLNEENVVARFDSTGANAIGALNVTSDITSPTILRIDNFAQEAFNTANAGYVSDGSAYAHANGAFDTANSAVSNTVFTQGIDDTQNTNITYVTTLAQASFDYANTITTGSSDSWARVQANSAFEEANAAYDLAQGAYDKANTGGSGGTTNSFGIITTSGYDDIVANTANSRLTFFAQTGIFIQNDIANSVISIGTNLIGASNVILDYGSVVDYLGVITFDYGYLT